MIYSITGKLKLVTPTFCVVDAGGVGYQCTASTNTLGTLPAKGTEVTLLTYLQVKEDGVELFGFASEQEKRCFQMLISVSGVGPRVALAILSDSAPDRLMLSIVGADVKAITRAQGVGPKLAQRIILELKDKVSKEDMDAGFLRDSGILPAEGKNEVPSAKAEAVSALVSLGYSGTDAASVIARLEDGLAVDELVRKALKSFMRG